MTNNDTNVYYYCQQCLRHNNDNTNNNNNNNNDNDNLIL